MKKLLLAGLLCAGFLAAPVRAQEYKTVLGNPDLNLIMGYKMWLNNWSSWNTGQSGNNFVEFNQGGVAHIFSTILRYKAFFTGFSYLFTGDYTFPAYTDKNAANGTDSVVMKSHRNEIDWNVGYMVVPQLGFTAGLKSVTQNWKQANNGAAFTGAGTNWNWLGPTLGIVGSAPIGNGFSLYGNGAGGFMSVTQDPKPTVSRSDTASYESAELGVAWRAQSVPLSASFGYKFQRINTKLDIAGLDTQRGLDLTSGYVLGLNLIF
jgi:hypothetical protein